MTPHPTNLKIEQLLAERRQIAIIWSMDDVKERRPDLKDDECWAVLQEVEREHEADCGITWDSLAVTADKLFGEAPQWDEP